MTWNRSPTRRTRIGCTIPLSWIEAASSPRRAGFMAVRGWTGFGSSAAVGTSAAESGRAGAGSGSGRRAESPLPSAFRFMAHHFLGQVQVRLGALRPYVIENNRLTKTGGRPQAHAAGNGGGEDLVLEVVADLAGDLLGQVGPLVHHG